MATLKEVYEKLTVFSPPRPWPTTSAAAMAGAAALLRNQPEERESEGNNEDNAKAEPSPPFTGPTEKARIRKDKRIAPSPAERAASNQLRGLTGLTPIGGRKSLL